MIFSIVHVKAGNPIQFFLQRRTPPVSNVAEKLIGAEIRATKLSNLSCNIVAEQVVNDVARFTAPFPNLSRNKKICCKLIEDLVAKS